MKDKYGNEHSPENGQFVSQGTSGGSSAKDRLSKAIDKHYGYYKISQVSEITNETVKKALGNKLKTDKVGISPERIDHIHERHPNEYNIYAPYIDEILNEPNEIIGSAHKSRVLFVKKVERRVVLVLEMQTKTNVIITLHKARGDYVEVQKEKYGKLFPK